MVTTKNIDEVFDTQQKKIAFFQNLILIVTADKIVDGDESIFLLEIGNRLGLSAEEVMPIADNLDVLSFIIPENGLQKTLELQTLVQMSLRDGTIDSREYALCREYSVRIGYSKDILDDMIKLFIGKDNDPDKSV
ncbi:MAG: hypothetical protein M3421_13300 [Bacteroidota bacterium]|jgi:hypothetical protein|nr:hypothetical protein [Bacteroidota bacterium]